MAHRGIVILFSVHNDVCKIHLLAEALIPHELYFLSAAESMQSFRSETWQGTSIFYTDGVHFFCFDASSLILHNSSLAVAFSRDLKMHEKLFCSAPGYHSQQLKHYENKL